MASYNDIITGIGDNTTFNGVKTGVRITIYCDLKLPSGIGIYSKTYVFFRVNGINGLSFADDSASDIGNPEPMSITVVTIIDVY